jgi:hypothetical protein
MQHTTRGSIGAPSRVRNLVLLAAAGSAAALAFALVPPLSADLPSTSTTSGTTVSAATPLPPRPGVPKPTTSPRPR